jgi:hypothetical protein
MDHYEATLIEREVNEPTEVLRPVGAVPTAHRVIDDMQKQINKLNERIEALELVASYAKDVVDFWPSMTMRTIRAMIPKMAALKEALDLTK